MSEQRAVVRHEHARIGRKIINFDKDGYGICAWADCDKDACNLYEVRVHEHAGVVPCNSSLAKHVKYAFHSERCKQYWLACTGSMARDTEARNNGRVMGMLPPGWKKTIL